MAEVVLADPCDAEVNEVMNNEKPVGLKQRKNTSFKITNILPSRPPSGGRTADATLDESDTDEVSEENNANEEIQQLPQTDNNPPPVVPISVVPVPASLPAVHPPPQPQPHHAPPVAACVASSSVPAPTSSTLGARRPSVETAEQHHNLIQRRNSNVQDFFLHGNATQPSNAPYASFLLTRSRSVVDSNKYTDTLYYITSIVTSNEAQHGPRDRFKVVKIDSSDPAKKGRWTNLDFADRQSATTTSVATAGMTSVVTATGQIANDHHHHHQPNTVTVDSVAVIPSVPSSSIAQSSAQDNSGMLSSSSSDVTLPTLSTVHKVTAATGSLPHSAAHVTTMATGATTKVANSGQHALHNQTHIKAHEHKGGGPMPMKAVHPYVPQQQPSMPPPSSMSHLAKSSHHPMKPPLSSLSHPQLPTAAQQQTLHSHHHPHMNTSDNKHVFYIGSGNYSHLRHQDSGSEPNHMVVNNDQLEERLEETLQTQDVSEGLVSVEENNSEDAESASGTNQGAIDNRIEQAMDLVKSHLMNAVRSEIEEMKEKIIKLEEHVSILQAENEILRLHAPPEVLNSLQQHDITGAQQQHIILAGQQQQQLQQPMQQMQAQQMQHQQQMQMQQQPQQMHQQQQLQQQMHQLQQQQLQQQLHQQQLQQQQLQQQQMQHVSSNGPHQQHLQHVSNNGPHQQHLQHVQHVGNSAAAHLHQHVSSNNGMSQQQQNVSNNGVQQQQQQPQQKS